MAVVVTVRGRWPVLDGRPAPTAPCLVRLLVAALLLTANWTAYVWAVANDRVVETALGYFMAPLATMLLGVTRARRAGDRGCSRLALALARAGRRRAHDLLRPPAVSSPLIIAASWSLYGLLKRQVPLTPVESLAGETFLLLVPAVVAGRRDGRRAGQHPVDRDRRPTGCSSPSPASSPPCPLLLFAVAAQRVPVHAARRAAVPRADDQPRARLARLRRADAGRPARRLRPRVGGAVAVTVDQVRPPARALRDVGFTPTGGG